MYKYLWNTREKRVFLCRRKCVNILCHIFSTSFIYMLYYVLDNFNDVVIRRVLYNAFQYLSFRNGLRDFHLEVKIYEFYLSSFISKKIQTSTRICLAIFLPIPNHIHVTVFSFTCRSDVYIRPIVRVFVNPSIFRQPLRLSLLLTLALTPTPAHVHMCPLVSLVCLSVRRRAPRAVITVSNLNGKGRTFYHNSTLFINIIFFKHDTM